MAIQREEERGLQTVQAVLDKQMSILEAAHGLLPLLQMNPALASQDDFNLVRAIASETDDLPIGRLRELWHPDSLAEKDREIKRLERLWHEQVLSACERIRRMLLLRKLVLDRHLSLSERHIVGVVARQEVVAILKSLLLTEGVFPIEGREGFGYEGTFVGRVSSGAQLIRTRTYPANPHAVAEHRVDHFQNIDAAIEAFIDCEWNNGIDGIPFMSSR
jgi:hypothetical protein